MSAHRTAPSARALRPRATDSLIVSPVLVSDKTAAALVGLEPRQFRAFVTNHGIPCLHHGRRILVTAKALEAAIAKCDVGEPVEVVAEDVEPSREEILARIGGRR